MIREHILLQIRLVYRDLKILLKAKDKIDAGLFMNGNNIFVSRSNLPVLRGKQYFTRICINNNGKLFCARKEGVQLLRFKL